MRVDRKAARAGWPKGKADADAPLAGHTLAMIFEKNSTRTRVSFDMAIRQLGGTDRDGRRHDAARPRRDRRRYRARAQGYVDAIMIRTDDHAKIVEMAAHASVPVINGLTD
jgi:ornithine carbamoyltransferase